MIVHKELTLKEKNGEGRVEVRVSHNGALGARHEAEQAWLRVLSVMIEHVEDAGGIVLEFGR